MLFMNDVFLLSGEKHRLLHSNGQKAWVLSMENRKAWPIELSAHTLSEFQSVHIDAIDERQPTKAMLRALEKAKLTLGDLPKKVPEIFDAKMRAMFIEERVAQGYCRATLYRLLRRYWVGGQSAAALMPAFDKCGRTQSGVTGNRGAKCRYGGNAVSYQLTKGDIATFRKVIDEVYLADINMGISATYSKLIREHYQALDANGKAWIHPSGMRPSLRQFGYFLRKNYSLQVRLRRRHGEKDYERDHRPILDSVLSRCYGVGHQYEADATIADVYLVASADRKKIIGKPTIYYIIDRKSRLIVGWYVGLENPSWVCALQALQSISADKSAICQRYGVTYDPADWPAHEVFPAEVIADRGEMLTRDSERIAENLYTTVVNLPSQRPDHKPIVESAFKVTRVRLQDGVPGFDPPENAKRRMGKKYEKDACLTLDEFSKIILLSVIEHNRRPIKEYDLSPAELTAGLIPAPLDIWRHDVVSRAGALAKFTASQAQMALLPRGMGTVSEEGILFKGCYYTCPQAIASGLFTQARKQRFKVEVIFDMRLVDSVWIRLPRSGGQRSEVHLCTLTPNSVKYGGLSFAEVELYERLRGQNRSVIEQARLQASADYHRETDAVAENARRALKAAGPKKSRTARRKDIKPDRLNELRTERQTIAGHQPSSTFETGNNTGKVIPFGGAKEAMADSSSAPKTESLTPVTTNLNANEHLRRLREKMKNG